ncbi:hypothetical protein [Microbacterium sp. 5K110]|uniref:hypothetical protein n=1 Tax=unclassified Microbacterium TaxID=2609290 RepID=UPI0010FD193F|nr:hypothetical protein [Microbacterium sp. 5K110]TLF33946.1 hypothetical protein FE256_02175 [Microbacterium sp. 5K110]
MSRLIGEAFAEWRECRAAFDEVLEAAYSRAEEATNGALLNARGREARVKPRSIFYGPQVRALAYASPELLEHWEEHPRVTYAEFERQWVAAREAERWAS